MKAIQVVEPGTVRLIDLPMPRPAEGEVLLQVHTAGYCGSDLNTFRGVNPLVEYPRILGHEIGARIVALGEGIDSSWSVGQDILIYPYAGCGQCSACRLGRSNCCRYNETLGVQRDGAMAEFVALPTCHLMPAAGLAHHELALVEPLTVGRHAAMRGDVTSGDDVLVLGCGAIGLGVIAGAAELGGRVVAVDVDDRKLTLARRCGAAEGINSLTSDLKEQLLGLTDGHGPAVVIEAVGLPETYRAAIDLVAYAGRVVYIGWSKAPVEYETKNFVLKELDIRGSRNALAVDFEAVVRRFQAGRVPTAEIITRTVCLDDACDALREWNDSPGNATKIQIQVSSGA